MALTIKSKIALGIGVLFALLVTVSIVAISFINMLSFQTENLLTANYNTIMYCSEMSNYLPDLGKSAAAADSFERYLTSQEHNITEPGEKEATAQLRQYFEQAKKSGLDEPLFRDITRTIYKIYLLNQNSLNAKNQAALNTSSNAKVWLTCLATLLVLISFSFVVNFPGYIANPIRMLTDGIKEIGQKNYEKRIHLESRDEFGEVAEAFNQMAKRLYEYDHSNLSRLMFEKRRVEIIINQMDDAVVGLDADNKILFINHNAEKLFYLREAEVIGKPATEVAKANDLLRVMLQKNNNMSPMKIIVDGKENYFVPEHRQVSSDGAVIGEVMALRNITSFKEMDISKTNLLATISHELKTPISSIKMSTKLLKDPRIGAINNEQKELVLHVEEDANRLLKITGELLNLAQLESGNIQLKLHKVNPKDIVEESVSAVRVQAEQKNINLVVQCPDTLPFVHADADKTSWVLVNFLTNAIKYSDDKSQILISVQDFGQKKVRFSVEDFGKGIEEKYISRVFDRYFKAPGSIEKSSTGLGLAICKEFINAQGGEITVKSEFGKGSTFSFSLPV